MKMEKQIIWSTENQGLKAWNYIIYKVSEETNNPYPARKYTIGLDLIIDKWILG